MMVATPIEIPTLSEKTNGESVPMGWECNENAECVEVPACNEERCQTSLDVRMHGTWYDLSGRCARDRV